MCSAGIKATWMSSLILSGYYGKECLVSNQILIHKPQGAQFDTRTIKR